VHPLQLYIPCHVFFFFLSPDSSLYVGVFVCCLTMLYSCVSGRSCVAHWVYHGDQLAMRTLDLFVVGAPVLGCQPTMFVYKCACVCLFTFVSFSLCL
jgi:hypothetical protein